MSDRCSAWAAARRVLAVRLDNLGDVLMTTPALAALAESAPGRALTLLASPGGAALAPHLPFVDDAIEFAAPWVKGDAAAGDDAELAALVERLRARRFDAAVVFTTCTQSALPAALLCRMAGIPLRLAHARENPYALLTDWQPERDAIAPGMRHEVARQLDLVGAVGCTTPDSNLRFAVGERDRADARAALRDGGLAPGERYVVVHVGASAPSRRYPAERFGQAADSIARLSGCTPVFTGGGDEVGLVEAARAQTSEWSISLAGALGLGALGALIEDAALVVANNTGPVHLAAAVGTPVVDLYALTNPQHTPWQVPSRVLSREVPCRDCLKSTCPQGHHECLRGIPPTRVVGAALELLAARRQALAA